MYFPVILVLVMSQVGKGGSIPVVNVYMLCYDNEGC